MALHMLRQHLPDVPVIFLETGYHFAELIAYRDRMAKEWGLNLVNAMPSTTVKEFEGQFGKLHIVQPTAVLPGAEGGAADALAGAVRLVVYGAAA